MDEEKLEDEKKAAADKREILFQDLDRLKEDLRDIDERVAEALQINALMRDLQLDHSYTAAQRKEQAAMLEHHYRALRAAEARARRAARARFHETLMMFVRAAEAAREIEAEAEERRRLGQKGLWSGVADAMQERAAAAKKRADDDGGGDAVGAALALLFGLLDRDDEAGAQRDQAHDRDDTPGLF